MKPALVAILLVTAAFLASPVASACPDPDHPCTPQPIDPFPECQSYPGPTGFVKGLLTCIWP